jgi:hypothetical protein
MIATNPTTQALRDAIYAVLTAVPLNYQVDAQPLVIVPAAQIVPKAIWQLAQHFAPNPPPMPVVAFAVEGVRRSFSRRIMERELRLHLWIISDASTDDVTMLYEAIRARIFLADQDAPPGTADLSRAASSTTLPLIVRECVEIEAGIPDFNDVDQRYEMKAEYSVTAL